jgi:hypothetical protein
MDFSHILFHLSLDVGGYDWMQEGLRWGADDFGR